MAKKPKPPPPPPPPPPTGTRSVLGGWRLVCPFARGAIAIDFTTRTIWLAGAEGDNDVREYRLPEMGVGSDVSAYPRLDPVRSIPAWWESGCYANGLCVWQGKLWAAPRKFYDMAPPSDLTISAVDGETLTIPLPRQAFSGFVKTGPNQAPLIGGGGYESGQGSVSGPTLATLDGRVQLQYGWPQSPGASLEHWQERAPRPTNYYPVNHVDAWTAWEPRTVNGVLEGRWACDRVFGGGLVLPEGIVYWPFLGTGDINYARQTLTFGAGTETCEYVYNASTFALARMTPTLFARVGGQDLGPDGLVYLSLVNGWKSGLYTVDPVVQVFK